MPLLEKSFTFVIAVLVWINSPTNEMCSLGTQSNPCLIAHNHSMHYSGWLSGGQVRVERIKFLRN